MSPKRKKPNYFVDEVFEKKKCFCGKVFNDEDNLNNIKKHFNVCKSCKVREDIRNWTKKQNVQPEPPAPDVPATDDSTDIVCITMVIGDSSGDSVESSEGLITGSNNDVLGAGEDDGAHDNDDIAVAVLLEMIVWKCLMTLA